MDVGVHLALPEIDNIEFDPDYNLHIRPEPDGDDKALKVYFSVNLRNVLKVRLLNNIHTSILDITI